jgi:hypothetical protein
VNAAFTPPGAASFELIQIRPERTTAESPRLVTEAVVRDGVPDHRVREFAVGGGELFVAERADEGEYASETRPEADDGG